MTRVDEQLLQRMTTAIVEMVDPEQVILFGSHARGAAGTDSDIDLVVVEAEPFGPGRDRGAEETRLWRALAKFSMSRRTFWSTAARRSTTGAIPSTMCSHARCGRATCSMSDLKQARILVKAAERKVSALHGMGDPAVFANGIFGFHVQQAAEKLLKAWLASLGEAYPICRAIWRRC